jgi:hypothetical protein
MDSWPLYSQVASIVTFDFYGQYFEFKVVVACKQEVCSATRLGCHVRLPVTIAREVCTTPASVD